MEGRLSVTGLAVSEGLEHIMTIADLTEATILEALKRRPRRDRQSGEPVR